MIKGRKFTAHSLSRLAHGRRPVAISRMQHPRDQISSAPCRPLSEPVMTKVRKIRTNSTFRRHIHRCAGHAVQIRSGHSNASFSLALLREDLCSSKIGKFDITNSVKEDVYISKIQVAAYSLASHPDAPLPCYEDMQVPEAFPMHRLE